MLQLSNSLPCTGINQYQSSVMSVLGSGEGEVVEGWSGQGKSHEGNGNWAELEKWGLRSGDGVLACTCV